ncbi:discoidin domain-containing protein [Amycolatopsis sp.]|uniref:discoidin domain-containing protein n=1 Tax=Amycolatopsis sp. TaxID=37632 RepID=UPI002E070286|nr:discoidin domain-containing protein [Amycolatopsis sp.]
MRGRLRRSTVLWAVAGAVACLITSALTVQIPAAEATYRAGGNDTIHVAPNGHGGQCSASNPCGIDDAQRKVRQLRGKTPGDIVVRLADGTYRLDKPLEFSDQDSGSPGHQVVWEPEPGAKPVLSGGRRITGWARTDAAHGVWSAKVPASLQTRQLYVDGNRAPIAQGPAPVALTRSGGGYAAADAGYAQWRNPADVEFVFTRGNGDWTESRCRVAGIDGTNIAMQQPCWDNVTNRPKPAIQAPYYFPDLAANATPTRIENAYELLHPGQWYLDNAAHVLYYVPLGGADPNRSDIEAPTLQTLVSGNGTLDNPVHDIVLRGLQFSYATWLDPSGPDGFSEIQANLRITGDQKVKPQGTCNFTQPAGTCPFGANAQEPANVTWRAAKNVTIENNTFTHLGAAGLAFAYGSTQNLVRGNTFTDISGIGVMLGSSNDPHPSDVGANDREINVGNRVENNYIHHIGVEYPGADGIFLFYTRQTTVAHNEIANVPWDGIDSGANAGHLNTADHPDVTTNINADNVIADNLVHDFHSVLADGGAIYLEGHQGETLRKPDGSIDEEASFQHGTHVTGNVVYNDLHSGLTLYNDIGSQWITWNRNVEFNNGAGNGGCAPNGHLRFIGNYHSDQIAVYPCGPPAVDLQYSANVEMPLKPGAADLPQDIVANAGLEPAYRFLSTTQAPRVASVTPRKGLATAPTDVLITGSGFTAGSAVSWAGAPATAVKVLSPTFIVATAPAGASLAEAAVTTSAGSYAGPSGLPLAGVTADSMDDEVFWRSSFDAYNVVDLNQNTYWSSAATAMPHWIQVQFTHPVKLGKVVVKARRLGGLAIPGLTVSASAGGAPPQVVGTVSGNAAQDVSFSFPAPVNADTIRVQVDSATYQGSPRNNADLAEIEFYDQAGNRLGH